MQVISFPGVQEFIKSLEGKTRGKVFSLIELLEILGLSKRPPESKKIAENLYELRTSGRSKVRIFYTVKNGRAFLLSTFVKKSWKLPPQEIQKAKNRIDALARYSR